MQDRSVRRSGGRLLSPPGNSFNISSTYLPTFLFAFLLQSFQTSPRLDSTRLSSLRIEFNWLESKKTSIIIIIIIIVYLVVVVVDDFISSGNGCNRYAAMVPSNCGWSETPSTSPHARLVRIISPHSSSSHHFKPSLLHFITYFIIFI